MNTDNQKLKFSKDYLRFLKASAHHLKPVVQVGKLGLTDSLMTEVVSALDTHELIKISFLPKQKENISEIIELISNKTDATIVRKQGLIVTFFLAKKEDSQYNFKTK